MNPEKESNFRASLSKANEKIFAKDMIKIQKDKHIGRPRKTAATILNVLCRQPKVTITDLVNITKIPRPTITNTVKKMVDIGIMHPTRPTKSWQVYYYSSILGTAKELSSGDIRNQTKQGCYLSFKGREEAIAIANIPTKIKFEEDVRHNEEQNNQHSKNSLYISDNILLLKHLIKTKSKPFHLIFGDVVYNQREARKPRQYQDTYDEHAGYLQFMYPRLMLCKELLDDKGLLVLAVGEDEVANTKLICSEIFPNGFLDTIVVESGVNAGIYSSHSDKFIADTKFYLLVFVKDRKKIRFLNRLYDLVDKKFAKEYNTIITEDLKHEHLLDRLK